MMMISARCACATILARVSGMHGDAPPTNCSNVMIIMIIIIMMNMIIDHHHHYHVTFVIIILYTHHQPIALMYGVACDHHRHLVEIIIVIMIFSSLPPHSMFMTAVNHIYRHKLVLLWIRGNRAYIYKHYKICTLGGIRPNGITKSFSARLTQDKIGKSCLPTGVFCNAPVLWKRDI